MFCNVHLFEMLHVYIACNYSNSFLFCGNQFCGCCCLNRAAMAYQMIKTRLQLCLWRSTQDVRRSCKNKFIIYIFLLSFIKPQQNYRFIIIHIYIYIWMNRQNGQTDVPTVWFRHAIWRYMYVHAFHSHIIFLIIVWFSLAVYINRFEWLLWFCSYHQNCSMKIIISCVCSRFEIIVECLSSYVDSVV